MKLYGSPDRLGQYPCEAVVITDSFITDTHIYIQEPTLTFNEHTNQYVEMLKIFSSPKNMGGLKSWQNIIIRFTIHL
jgi:hypothetical protein